mgnify:CR=1 FL=1
MKKKLTLLLGILSFIGYATAQDVIYLKNGCIIKGNINEIIPTEKISIVTLDNKLLEYDINDIERIINENRKENNDTIASLSPYTEYIKDKGLKKSVKRIAKTETDKTDKTQKTKKKFGAIITLSPYKIYFLDKYKVASGITVTMGSYLGNKGFLGGGLGCDIIYKEDYINYHIPIYTTIRGFIGKSIAQFTYGARIGAAVVDCNYRGNTNYTYGHTNYHDVTVTSYSNINLGLRLVCTKKFAITITEESDIYLGKRYFNVGWALRLGFEF